MALPIYNEFDAVSCNIYGLIETISKATAMFDDALSSAAKALASNISELEALTDKMEFSNDEMFIYVDMLNAIPTLQSMVGELQDTVDDATDSTDGIINELEYQNTCNIEPMKQMLAK